MAVSDASANIEREPDESDKRILDLSTEIVELIAERIPDLGFDAAFTALCQAFSTVIIAGIGNSRAQIEQVDDLIATLPVCIRELVVGELEDIANAKAGR